MTPSVSPLSSPSGLIYRYVLQSPDRSPMELKTFEDWIIEPQYRSVPGVADDSGFGGGTMQYQVLLDPVKVAAVGLSVAQVESCARPPTTATPAAGSIRRAASSITCAAWAGSQTLEDIGNVVLAVHNGTPVLVKDVGRVVIGIAPRLGEFGYEKQDDAVEGVILLRTGREDPGRAASGSRRRPRSSTTQILPKDVKVHAVLRPQRPDRADDAGRGAQPAARHAAGGRGADLLPLRLPGRPDRRGHHSAGAAVRVHLSRSAERLGQPAVDRRGRFRHPGGWRGGDGGEHLPPDRGAPRHRASTSREIIKDAAAEVDRPLFYAVAVIVVGFLPIYVLSGPSGTLFKPMADTMIFALIGSLIITLTLLPVLCPGSCAGACGSGATPSSRPSSRRTSGGSTAAWPIPGARRSLRQSCCAASLLLIPRIGAEFMPQLDEGALWVRATMPYTISFDEAAKIAPQVREILQLLSRGHHRRLGAGPARRRHRSHRLLQRRVLCRASSPMRNGRGAYRTKPALIAAIDRKLAGFPGINFNYTQPAEDAVDEAETGLKSALAVKVFGADLDTLQQKGKAIKQVLEQVRGITRRDAGAGARPAEPDHRHRPRQDRPLRPERRRHQWPDPDRHRRRRRDAGRAGGEAVRSRRPARSASTATTPEEIGNIPVATPGGQQIPLKELADIQVTNGASFIYRENNSRYIGVQFSVEGRDLAGAVGDAIRQVNDEGHAAAGLPPGLGRRVHRIHRVARADAA